MKKAMIHVCISMAIFLGIFYWIFRYNFSYLLKFFYVYSNTFINSITAIVGFIVSILVTSLILVGILMELYSMLFANKDMRAYRKNEKLKGLNKHNRLVRITDSVFNVLFIVSSWHIAINLIFHKDMSNYLKWVLSLIFTYIVAFIAQIILYKIIKSQIAKIVRAIKNTRAWR